MTFVLASNNKEKLRELRDIIAAFGLEVVSQSDVGIDLEVDETGETFYDNAFLKASAAMKASGLPAIADDSGLIVDALPGELGVRSKRYGAPGMTDTDRNVLLLGNMEGKEQRSAKFVSSVVCVFPNGDVVASEGICDGEILTASRGDNGFGYDPVFLVSGTGKSMAELSPQEKNNISHRGKALRTFEPKLREYLRKAGSITC